MQLKLFHKGFNYSQDGTGNRLVYHLQGCNLSCPWCANPEGMDAEGPDTFTMTIEEMCEEIVRCKPMFFDGGGVTFTGGEATCQFIALKEILTRLKRIGISTALETNGTSSKLPELFPVLDELIMDYKHYDSKIHKKIMGLGNDVIKENLGKAFVEHPKLLVRIPLIGKVNASECDIEQFIAFFNQYHFFNARFELLCYHEYGKAKWTKCGKEYIVQDAFVPEKTRVNYENKMRMCGFNIVRT
ncbi:MAG: radical SAM protein [Tyzzerella sp.]|nr:radical SAM protein [Tyzzerella sp.]